MSSDWTDDERLLADLGRALRAEREVPNGLVEVGRAAFAWRDADAELAALTFDSTAVPTEGAAVRAEPAALRALTFATATLSIELEVTPDALVGQLVPAQPGEIDVLIRDGTTTTVSADAVGWFTISPRPARLFRLHVRPTHGAAVITEWTIL